MWRSRHVPHEPVFPTGPTMQAQMQILAAGLVLHAYVGGVSEVERTCRSGGVAGRGHVSFHHNRNNSIAVARPSTRNPICTKTATRSNKTNDRSNNPNPQLNSEPPPQTQTLNSKTSNLRTLDPKPQTPGPKKSSFCGEKKPGSSRNDHPDITDIVGTSRISGLFYGGLRLDVKSRNNCLLLYGLVGLQRCSDTQLRFRASGQHPFLNSDAQGL